jgi:hypothetical protein
MGRLLGFTAMASRRPEANGEPLALHPLQVPLLFTQSFILAVCGRMMVALVPMYGELVALDHPHARAPD